ncbi:KdsC family phosphatase [Haliangium sp.]|uniref:KdsC family phosphatase n=1 Tax=Haliangium sp. TaxID=2663208 RepID=UPI003D09F14C
MSLYPAALGPALADVRLLALDVDGVLTDGALYYGAEGELLKAFNVLDGLGIRLLGYADVEVAVITARRAPALERRLRDLSITQALYGVENKGHALESLMSKLGLVPSQVAFVGDDLLDLPAFSRAGVAITVPNAHAMIRRRADWITHAGGGHGAVREIADALLAARDALDDACRRLLSDVGESAEHQPPR